MEVDFDKEIDTLLRKAHHDGPVLVGDVASGHLDADEISAFAENAMPDNSRVLYTAHLADCDRCRKILSNLLIMNAAAAPIAASSSSAIGIAGRNAPWYRGLFVFPDLAYVMGSLVLIFGGFLAFTVIRNSGPNDSGMVSQVTDTESTGSGPSFNDEPAYTGEVPNSNSWANVSSNTAVAPSAMMANTNASVAAGSPSMSANVAVGGSRAGQSNFVLDGTSSADTVTSAAAAPPAAEAKPVAKDTKERDDNFKSKAEDKAAAGSTLEEMSKNDAQLQKQNSGSLSQAQTQSGPMRNNENAYNRQLENLDRRRAAAAKKSGTRAEESESGSSRRILSGKTFERKQGVWYDATYQGRPTINVRRGSDEFNRLDAGLRSIANSLGGIVVVVWGAKAYRIQ